MMRTLLAATALAAVVAAGPAVAQTKVGIGISGWTGFAPITLAKEAGIFAKNGLDVTIKKIPPASRHLAIASGDIQCAGTTIETWVMWNAAGVATKILFQIDKSYGADGLVVRNNIASIKDLKGKTIAASAPGTSPNFLTAWFLKKNGLSIKNDVTIVNMEPGPAAQAFLAGQNDAASTYEPYLSAVRDKPEAGKIIATTLDYPMIMDGFGCTPKFIENEAAVKALVKSYYEALDMIKTDQKKAYEIMGADVKQTGEQFGKSAAYIRWPDKEAAKTFFAKEYPGFSKEVAELLMETGVIKQVPDLDKMIDLRFIQ